MPKAFKIFVDKAESSGYDNVSADVGLYYETPHATPKRKARIRRTLFNSGDVDNSRRKLSVKGKQESGIKSIKKTAGLKKPSVPSRKIRAEFEDAKLQMNPTVVLKRLEARQEMKNTLADKADDNEVCKKKKMNVREQQIRAEFEDAKLQMNPTVVLKRLEARQEMEIGADLEDVKLQMTPIVVLKKL